MKRKIFLPALIMVIAALGLQAQNVTVTDDQDYEAHPSAMLDVKANDKGVLVPRLTSQERLDIASPANGLLVYDTDKVAFMYFDGTEWSALSGEGEEDEEDGESLFEVENANGDTVFAVYSDGVRVNIPASQTKSKTGGFAVSGRNTSKGIIDYMTVTPGNTSINYDPTLTGKSKTGGFAISGRNTSKQEDLPIFSTTLDSTRIYINQPSKSKTGGFAVSGRNTSKNEVTKPFFDITPENYFIGHQSGSQLTEGLYNSAFGFEAGANLTSGSHNMLLGYQAGLKTEAGSNNIYLGAKAGLDNAGSDNIFIGHEAGSTFEQQSNQFILENSNAGIDEALMAGNFESDELRLNANVGIKASPEPDLGLHVAGSIGYQGDLIEINLKKPDYVFTKDYERLSIREVERHINTQNALPWLTPASEEEKGVNMSRMATETLEAVENLQLQIIDLHKENKQLKAKLKRLEDLETQNKQLRREIEQIKSMLHEQK